MSKLAVKILFLPLKTQYETTVLVATLATYSISLSMIKNHLETQKSFRNSKSQNQAWSKHDILT